MKLFKHVFVVGALVLALTGCGDSKQIAEVKALAFADTNMTVENALDTRKICDSVKWSVEQDDRNQTYVQYVCNYKGVDDSAFLQGETPKAINAADVWQWTYDASGTPTLTGVSMVVRHDDGSVHEVLSGGIAGMLLSKLIVSNEVEDYDHIFASVAGRRIPEKTQEQPAPVPAAITQVATAPAAQPATLGQALADAQGNPDPLPTGSGDSDFPAMTPCLQKLEDSARKQAVAQGVDDAISIDAANEMANTCKTLGQ